MNDFIEINKLRRQQASIAQFGSFALNENNLQIILNEAARVCADGLGTKYSKICRFRPEEGDLLIEAGHGWRAGIIGNVVSKADISSPQGRAFITGEPAICEDLATDEVYRLPLFYTEHGIVSTIDVLIKSSKKSYGVLEVDSDQRVVFDQQDIIYLTGFANVLAEALATTAQKAREAELLATEQTLKAQALESQYIAQAAKRSAEARALFITTMSHELRTPLNAIIGFLELVLETSLSAEQSSHLTVAQQNAKHLRVLVDDILDYGKIEAGESIIATAPFSIKNLILDIAATTKGLLLERPVDVNVAIDPELPSVFLGDATRIRQVLLNLSSNSAKLTKQGSISIRVKESVRNPDRPTLRFEVEDTGPGVDQSLQEKIFEFYGRNDNLGPWKEGSTGLGLAISKALVYQMEGKIGVRSDGNKGSTFWFELPLYISQPGPSVDVEPPPQKAQASRRKLLKFLIAEDVRSSRLLLEIILRKLGHEVRSCEDGVQAVAAAQREHFDIILMDIQMPDMNGLEATQAIRRIDGPSKSSLIVAVTADAFPERVNEIFNAGIDQTIIKPIDREAIEKLIIDFLKKSEFTHEAQRGLGSGLITNS
jgi:signal transduction histidine kinase/ActR/RegA family two-component response regulator